MKKVLLSTFGESPAVVTEAIDALEREGIRIDFYCLLTTKDSDARSALELLIEHIPSYYGSRVSLWRIIGSKEEKDYEAYGDIDSQEAVIGFMKQACGILREIKKLNWEAYVSIAGGRKTMSALMALAVQLYGAKELFHVIVEDLEVEEEGKISRLRNLPPEKKIKALHPPAEVVKLVRVPFVTLFPWIPDIVKVLKGEEVKTKDVRDFLVANRLLEEDRPTTLGQIFLEILEHVETSPEPCPEAPIGKEKIKIRDHHYRKESEEMAIKLAHRFPFVCGIQDIAWRQGESKTKAKGNRIEVYFRHRKGFNLALSLDTSAKTPGQLEWARREIEKWLD